MVLEKPKTPEEGELAEKRAALALLETELVERELELSTLQQQLVSFEVEYLRVVGTRYAELDEVTARIKEAHAAQQPADVTVQDEARAARETATASAAEMGRQDHVKEIVSFEPSESLKSLYRSLALKVHPDIAATDEQRQLGHEWFIKVQEAYKEQDKSALQALAVEWDTSPDSVEGEGVGSDLVRVIRQIASVKRRLETLSQAIDTLKTNELCGLMAKREAAREAGRNLLEEMAAKLESEVADARQVLADLQDQVT